MNKFDLTLEIIKMYNQNLSDFSNYKEYILCKEFMEKIINELLRQLEQVN